MPPLHGTRAPLASMHVQYIANKYTSKNCMLVAARVPSRTYVVGGTAVVPLPATNSISSLTTIGDSMLHSSVTSLNAPATLNSLLVRVTVVMHARIAVVKHTVSNSALRTSVSSSQCATR
jgi:hypothetical protein